MEEIWKTVKGHPNYEVCIDGRIRRKAVVIVHSNGMKCNYPERNLKPEVVRYVYHRVTFSKGNNQKRVSVHRVVADHFLEPVHGKHIVNHKDGNGLNNHADNLEWCTASENELHSYRVLGKVNPIRKLTDEQAREIRAMKGSLTAVKTGLLYGVSKTCVLKIWNNVYYCNA